jgi:hypothetical protein
MPYPDYSFVIIEEVDPQSGDTVRSTVVYKNIGEAKLSFRNAVDAGKRAFLYEEPPVSGFRRNDSQPLSQ